MAIFRNVQVSFWKDPKVLEEMTPEDRFFFIYLLTNPSATQIGISVISKKQMSFELGYSLESINALVDRFENHHKLIKYNRETRELAVKNWGRYNLNKGGKPMIDCVRKQLSQVKDVELLKYVKVSIPKEEIGQLFDEAIAKLENQITIDVKSEAYEKVENTQISGFAKLYEANIGLINGVSADWLNYISQEIDVELFKRAIEIATDKGKCNKAYVNGIIKQWVSNKITTMEKLVEYESNIVKKGGIDSGSYSPKYSKNEYESQYEDEDAEIYRKPTEEELARVRELFS